MAESSPRDVFINCPFDKDFEQSLRALVFAVRACGFRARCAREVDDGSETRIDKIYRIIEQSRYGIHDISRTQLDEWNGLPRFNMPLELGIFLGAKRFGNAAQKKKRALVLDTDPYRFREFISDLAGIDPTPHGGDPREMIRCTRAWLVTASKRSSIPSPQALLESYDRFVAGFDQIAVNAGLDPKAIAYPDYERLVVAWVKDNPGA